jgi:hypothetical protein
MNDAAAKSHSAAHAGTPSTASWPAAARTSSGPFWKGVGLGAVLALPLGWLLGHGALLPSYLGLFFFALFGLVLGATVYRVAQRGDRLPRRTVLAGTLLLVVFTWAVGMTREGLAFPEQMARAVVERAEASDLAGRTGEEFHRDALADINQFLATEHPPGGVLGYVHWAATSSVLPASKVDGLRRNIKSTQSRYGFIIRIALSLGLLTFGIGALTFSLIRPTPKSTPYHDSPDRSDASAP